MYEEFYSLARRPFSTLPDPSFLYWTKAHSLAFTVLDYGVRNDSPITVITGDVGCGKTTLVRHLMSNLPGEVSVGLISNLQEGRGDLLEWIMLAFGQEFEGDSYVRLFRRFQDFLLENYASGNRTVLIIDEAQNLAPKTLEELRMMLNVNADHDQLLQLVLIGQPQLRALLKSPSLEQFVQRIAADYHIEALGSEEVAAYIAHRLAQAGRDEPLFLPETCELIAQATGGVPRLINVLCDLCLVYGFSYERPQIDPDLLIEFLESSQEHGVFHQFRPVHRRPAPVRNSG